MEFGASKNRIALFGFLLFICFAVFPFDSWALDFDINSLKNLADSQYRQRDDQIMASKAVKAYRKILKLEPENEEVACRFSPAFSLARGYEP